MFSYQLAGGGNLPEFTSLLCVGEPGSGIVTEPESGREQTETVVYKFDGCEGEILFIHTEHFVMLS